MTGPAPASGLRLWPGVLLAAALWSIRFGVPVVAPGFEGYRIAFLGGLLTTLAVLAWWTFASRAPRAERWAALGAMAISLLVTSQVNHESLSILWLLGHAVPILCIALVGWAALTRNRWTPTREARLLTEADAEISTGPTNPAQPATDPVWPGFRGRHRDGVVHGVSIATDWSASPPVELWRRPIGPGWSSFAVSGGCVYTQEQRGEHEVVACYDLSTGLPVWRHRDGVRFFESNAGAGPRATPAVDRDHVYALGATGRLHALDAHDGSVAWSRDVSVDTGVPAPGWGFAGSPLVVGDDVVVAASGTLVAYRRETGEPRWTNVTGGTTYSSPHRVVIDGVEQVVLLHGAGATGVAPADGATLWEDVWKGQPLVQPAVTDDGDLLTSAGEGHGLRRLTVELGAGGWVAEERWTSNRLKPNFNDFAVHDGHAFGFDGRILACLDLESGDRRWKGGRYGQGQLLLLAEQGLLLVLSERGELALVEASVERFTELARMPVIEGKTWNHPVLVNDVLLVRNAQEMVALRLPRQPAS